MQLAFYKGVSGTGNGARFDSLIRWYQRRRGYGAAAVYCHVEIVLIDAGGPFDDTRLCFSSSPRDGGTRFKWIDLRADKWELITLPGFLNGEAREICQELAKRKYDWGAIFGFVLPFGEHERSRLMCSETAVRVIRELMKWKHGGACMNPQLQTVKPWEVCPARLYQLVQPPYGFSADQIIK